MFEVFIAAGVAGIIATVVLGYLFDTAIHSGVSPVARLRKHFSTVRSVATMFDVDISISRKRGKMIAATLLDVQLGYVVTMVNGKDRMEAQGSVLEADGGWSDPLSIEFGTNHGMLDMVQISHNARTIAEMRLAEQGLKEAAKVAKMNDFLDHVLSV